jgi:GT2 family glycosyltransferase
MIREPPLGRLQRMPQPFVSIIVPTYRRPVRLADCLAAFRRLDYPSDRFEVIVVDDGSGAPPEDVVAGARSHIQVSLVAIDHGGPAAARNAGAARGKGDLLAFTDDDCMVTPGWLRAFAARFVAGEGLMLGGRTVNALRANPYAVASQLLIDHLYRHYNADPRDARFFTSNNLAVSADAFRTVGGFDRSFPLPAAEDRELCLRWRRSGRRLVYVPEAVVRHAHPLTLGRFWRQHFTYGRGAFHLHTLLGRRREPAIAIESPVFYLRLLEEALRTPSWSSRASMATLLLLSQIANGAGFFRERWRATS